MSADNRLAELLSLWEERKGRGEPVSPEDLCRDCPDLIEVFKKRIAALRAFDPLLSMEAGKTQPGEPAAANPSLRFLAPAQQPDELGRLGPYRILRQLGAGGMGIVFLAEDTVLRRYVAIKTILPHVAASPNARERFLREARAAARIEHEHVVPVHQVGEENNVLYLAMPYLKGETLSACLDREQKLPLKEALRIAAEMAEGLAAAHAEGLVHRDIKPANVWLEGERRKVRLLDFGLARLQSQESDLTATGMVLGTPSFMAPEQAQGHPVDVRADLFSLGATLYRMLTGELPFPGNSPQQILVALAIRTPASLQKLDPTIPGAVNDLTLKLLSKDPAGRPPSASGTAQELRALLAEENSGKTEAVQVAQPPRRPRWVTMVLGVFLIALAGGVAAWFIFSGPTKPIPELKSVDSTGGPPVIPRPREKPFVLVRAGVEKGEFKSFAELARDRQAGDEVIVYGDGPFRLPLVEVNEGLLVLRSAPGFRPRFLPDETLFENDSPSWFRLAGGALTVEGCDLILRGRPTLLWSRALVGGGPGPCVFRGCRALGFETLTRDLTARTLTLENCLITTGNGGLGFVSAGCELTLVNNLIFCGYFLSSLQAPGGQTIRLRRNAFLFTCSPPGTLINENQAPGGNASIVAESNHFNFLACYGSRGVPLETMAYRKAVRWQGKENAYAGLVGGLAWNPQQPGPEPGSVEVPVFRYGWLGDPPTRWNVARDWWAEKLEAARRESGLADLGPDLALVGPGEAYFRGLEAEGRGVPPEGRRLAPVPGGRIALLRNGRAVGGYFRLQDALEPAQDGDVLDIRTDSELEGGTVPRNRGTLTIRAGPGYQPSLKIGLVAAPGTTLIIEGLRFMDSSTVVAPWDPTVKESEQGRIARLAYCALDHPGVKDGQYPEGRAIHALFQKADGSAGEVVRCFIPRPVGFVVRQKTQVHFRECILRELSCGGERGQASACQIELERCAFSRPWVGSHGQAILGQAPPEPRLASQWTARRCLFESNMHLTNLDAKPKWDGSRNFYLIGRTYPSNRDVWDLLQWKAYVNSPEEGSGEGDAPIANPRRWRLPPGNLPSDTGPELDRVAPGTN